MIFSRDVLECNGYTHCSTHIVKFPDCNSTMNLFGGKLLSWLDEIAAIYASNYIKHSKVVTANFGGLNFSTPTEIGKVVDFWAKIIKEGNTSITVNIIAAKKNMGTDNHIEVADTNIIFVAVDENGKPYK